MGPMIASRVQAAWRRRFLAPIRALSHLLAARLTQIDYDREMALVAMHQGTVLGIARYFADPDRLQAEYAVAARAGEQCDARDGGPHTRSVHASGANM